VQNVNLETCPVIRISAVGGDITRGLRIENITTGKYFIIGAQIDSGKYIEIDTDLLTVVDQDGTNQIANFNGDFLKLAAGTNSIKWTGSTGAHTLAMTFRGKYDGA
jgi:phage-related protein